MENRSIFLLSLFLFGLENVSSSRLKFLSDAVIVSASATVQSSPFSADISSMADYVNSTSVYYNFDFIGTEPLPTFNTDGLAVSFTHTSADINPLCQYYLCIKPLVRPPQSVSTWSYSCDSFLNFSSAQSPQFATVYPRPGMSHITVAVLTTDLTKPACNFEAQLTGQPCALSGQFGGNCTAVAVMNTNTSFALISDSSASLGPPTVNSSFSFEVNPTRPFVNDISVSIGVTGNAPVFVYEREDDLARLFRVGDLNSANLVGIFDSQQNTSLAIQTQQTQGQTLKFDLALPALRSQTANSRYFFTAAVPNGFALSAPVNVQVNVTQTTCPVTFYGKKCNIFPSPIRSFGTYTLANTNFNLASGSNNVYWFYAQIAMTGAETGFQIGVAYQVGVDSTQYNLPDIYLRAGNIPDETHYDVLVNTSANGQVKFYDSGPMTFDNTGWFLGLRVIGPTAQTQSTAADAMDTAAIGADPAVGSADDSAYSQRQETSQRAATAGRSSAFNVLATGRNSASSSDAAQSSKDTDSHSSTSNSNNADSSTSGSGSDDARFVAQATNLFVLWTESGCPSSCSGHGSCVNNVCQCDPNYTSVVDCSVYQVNVAARLSATAKGLLATFAIVGSIALGYLLCYYFRNFRVRAAMPGSGNVLGAGNAPGGGGAAAPLSGGVGSSGAFPASRPASSSASVNSPSGPAGAPAGAGPRGNIYGYNSLS